MSGIVLSASVRQNLLSLQSTASLLATTQNDLATGNKVNTALDNPTEFFTAQGLNNRASDISNLLDSIGNGVQVLQAANTGITSLQSLVANAQSIANQVLQTPTGYTTKSNVTSAAIPGANANNLLGPGVNATATGAVVNNKLTTPAGLPSIPTGRRRRHDSLATTPANGSVLKSTTTPSPSARPDHDDDGRQRQRHDRYRRRQQGDHSDRPERDRQHHRSHRLRRPSAPAQLQVSTGTTSNLTIAAGTGNALARARSDGRRPTNVTPPALSGETLSIAATGGGTATNIVFGTGAGQVSTLNQLNAALAPNNLQASVDTTGHINISTTNNAASATIGTIGPGHHRHGNGCRRRFQRPDRGGSGRRSELASDPRQPGRAVQSGAANINTTAQDSSFNGINLLNGDTLNLTFDETGASKLAIPGYTLNDAGLSLSNLNAGTDFLDSNSANTVLTQLTQASNHCCARQLPRSARTCRSCRSARTSTRT